MDFINVQKIIYDSSLIMAIIAINMTIIGLTSLAEFKKVIGIDYGSFLIKKFKIFYGFTVYHVLVIFAVINVSSLFFIFIDNPTFRLINFLLLVFSLIFAIYYFFAFIIVDNKAVRRQIYQLELENLYIESNNTNHHEADKLTGMNNGSSRHKKISSNLIDFFDMYNDDTQTTFQEVFGPDSLLYDNSRKRKKRYRKNYAAQPYIYRKNGPYIADISYEFLQFLRYSSLSDKWSIEILRLMDGQALHSGYDSLRLYNFARLIAQINLFISTGEIYKYKFLQHLKQFYYQAVNIDVVELDLDSEHIKKVEKYIFKELLQLMFGKNDNKDSLFYDFAEKWIIEIIHSDPYKGLLSKDEFIVIMLDEMQKFNNVEYRKAFTEALSAYYDLVERSNNLNVPNELKLETIKNRIVSNSQPSAPYKKVPQKDLFGETS